MTLRNALEVGVRVRAMGGIRPFGSGTSSTIASSVLDRIYFC